MTVIGMLRVTELGRLGPFLRGSRHSWRRSIFFSLRLTVETLMRPNCSSSDGETSISP